jgi:glucose/arabinose dehydrogenase
MVERAIVPDYALSSRVTALALAFANDSAMPEAFRDGAFIGNHGSWNEKPSTATL